MTKYILLAGIIFSFITNTYAGFVDLIKKDSEIPVKEHPSLFFSAEDIPRLRKKARSEYFKAHTADLLTAANIMLKKFPGKRVFPFSENPNFQTITETLAMAYVITGDKKYSRRAIELATTFVNAHYEKVPIRSHGKFAGWMQRGNSTTFILIPISFVYDTLYDQMTEQERFDIRKGLAYFCQITYDMICTAEYGMSFYKNYTAGETGALGIACMVLKQEIDWPVQTWFERALRYTISWLNVAVKADGMFPEGTSYFAYTAGNQMLFLNAISHKHKIKYFDKTNLKNTLKWLNWGILPWKSEMDNFSDGSYNSSLRNIPFMFQQAYPGLGDYLVKQQYGAYPRYYSNPFALLFGDSPDSFNPDQELGNSALFEHGGMAAFRSGWSTQDVLMFIYATKYEYSAHSQADRGHFNLYGYGHKWLVDSGYGNDAKRVNSGTPTQAHSLVLIDGKGEGFDPSMRQSGTFADIDRYIANDKIGYVRVDQKDAYDFFNRYTHANRHIYNPVNKAHRNLIFVNKSETPPYALIYDNIDKDGKTHDYTYLLQLARGKEITTDGKQDILLQPYVFSGNAISNFETGKYGDFKKPGYRIFNYLTGYMKFKINVSQADKYIMWTFAKDHPGFSSEVGIKINGKNYGRSKIAFSIDYDWYLTTANRKKMHKAYVFDLKRGENIIEFRGVTQGYKLLKGLLVKYSPEAAAKMPVGYTPENVTGISFDASNLIDKNDVQVVKVSQKASSECRIKALWPQNGTITIDNYQPTKDAAHKRMKLKVRSVTPDFLFMFYPKTLDMRLPQCHSQKIQNGIIKATIRWNNCQDIILVNTAQSIVEDKESGIKTDGQLTFCRLAENGKIIRLLSSGCTSLEKSGFKLYNGKARTIIYEDGKLKKEKYIIDRTSKQRKVPKMINWKKAVIGTVAATAIAISSHAAALNTWARLDINAEAGRITLTPEKEKSSKGVAVFKASWRKDKKDFYLSSRAYFKKDIWRKVKIAFTPDKDGKAKLMFLGAWLPKPKQKNLVWFKYVNIKVNGTPISFDDKGWKLGKGAQIIDSKGPDGKEVKCLKAKCYSTGDYTIKLKKDQTVIIEFDVKITK